MAEDVLNSIWQMYIAKSIYDCRDSQVRASEEKKFEEILKISEIANQSPTQVYNSF